MKIRISLWVLFLCASCALFVCRQGYAQDAKQVYEEAVKAFKESRYLDAAKGFRKAYDLKPSWKLQYNIGQSEAAAKRHGLALEAFETYLSQGGDDIRESRREEVLGEVERLRKMVGSVEIDAPKGSQVFVDGVLRGDAPLLGKLPVAASVKHTAYARKNGEKTQEVPFKVMGDDTFRVELRFEKAAPAPVAAKPVAAEEDVKEQEVLLVEEGGTADDPGKGLRTAGWVFVGVGAAALIGGAVTGGMAMGVDGDLEGSDDCENGHCDESRGADIDKLNNLSVTTDILIGVGAAAAVTGLVLVIVGHKKGKEANVAFTPAFGESFAGAAVSGRF